jgi:hypothetical protein
MAVESDGAKESGESSQRSESSSMRELFRKTVSNTVRSVGGDERIRQAVQSVLKEETVQAVVNSKVAKDAFGYAVRTLDSLKEDMVSMAGRKMNDFLGRIDLGSEIQKILTTLSLEVRAEVRFIPNDKKVVKPEVKSKVTLKRNKSKSEKSGASEELDAAPKKKARSKKKAAASKAKTATRASRSTKAAPKKRSKPASESAPKKRQARNQAKR